MTFAAFPRAAGAALLCAGLAAPMADADTWSFDQKLTADDGAAFDDFGSSVALFGTTALVGARFDDDNGADSGSAYLFDTTTGTQLHKLTASDGAAGDRFGLRVALSGSTALVGASADDDNGVNSGSAYLFDTTTGTQLRKLTAPDGAALDSFGGFVALSGTTALVGAVGDDENGIATGSAYLFDTTTGDPLHKLTAPDGAAYDFFGSVALSGTTALVGAKGGDGNAIDSGAAYLFDTKTGDLLRKLTAPDGAAGDWFGISVALSGSTALVGARLDDDDRSNSGSAYLFDTTTGNLLHKLTAPDGAVSDEFGTSVALFGTTALVSSLSDDNNGVNSGAVYLFDTTTGSFVQKLTAPDGAALDYFGSSVALSDTTALVGARLDDDNGNASGSAYVFYHDPASIPPPAAAPIPLPAPAWMLLSGLGLLALHRRRARPTA